MKEIKDVFSMSREELAEALRTEIALAESAIAFVMPMLSNDRQSDAVRNCMRPLEAAIALADSLLKLETATDFDLAVTVRTVQNEFYSAFSMAKYAYENAIMADDAGYGFLKEFEKKAAGLSEPEKCLLDVDMTLNLIESNEVTSDIFSLRKKDLYLAAEKLRAALKSKDDTAIALEHYSLKLIIGDLINASNEEWNNTHTS